MITLEDKMKVSTTGAPVDDPRAVNEVLALLDSTWLDPTVHARPTHYNIATSVVCNIKCVFCPRQTLTPLAKKDFGYLTADYFEEVKPHLGAALRTGMFGLGEPFLNPNFFDFLKAAKERGTYCMTSSHGMSLKPRVIGKILDHGLDELCVSFDGATARTTNFLRNGADFDTVRRQVGDLIRQRNERGLDRPRVHMSFTVSKYNMWEMSKGVRLAHELGVDMLAFSNLVLDNPEHAHVSAVGSRIYEWNLARAKRVAKKLGVEMMTFYQIPYPYKEQPVPPTDPGVRYGCLEAWRAMIVERDGNMKPCCYLDLSYGNVHKGDYVDQLNSEAAIGFRRTFTERRYKNICKGCGQFGHITNDRTNSILSRTNEKIENGNFSDETRILLREKLNYFQDLADRHAAV